jgi:glyoxylase-like metal-dependent hydrolase (beta-lactamase superfamily II)
MESKRIFYQKLRDLIYHIPGENPSPFSLCGTNCFVIGKGPSRVMIESGDFPEYNSKFLQNFLTFLDDSSGISIDKIFITHAHHDHFGGLYDVLTTLLSRGQKEPLVYKRLDGNQSEEDVFNRFPSLRGKVLDLKHG